MTGAVDIRYAGFWRRLGASLVDAVIFLPNYFIVTYLDGISRPAAIFAVLFGPTVYYTYTLYLTHHYGGTLGKLALGVRVQPAGGGLLTWRHVWRRSAVDMLISVVMIASTIYGLSRVSFPEYSAASVADRTEILRAVIPWVMALGAVYMIWIASEFVTLMTNRRRRALHDFIAGTVVVLVRREEGVQTTSPVSVPTV